MATRQTDRQHDEKRGHTVRGVPGAAGDGFRQAHHRYRWKGIHPYTVSHRAVLVLLLVLVAGVSPAAAGNYPHPGTYLPSFVELERQKAMFDDPRPYLEQFGPRHVLPPELYSRLVYDVGEMKRQWAELVGFAAPEAVGKISPEIKPGKYSYRDLEQNPALRALLYDDLAKRIKPGGPPFAGSIPEFEILPTRQYYWALPVSEATRKQLHKARLDDKGYLIQQTWEAGYPFPRPEGRFKAQQVMYNFEKRYLAWGSDYHVTGRAVSFDRNLKMDFSTVYGVREAALAGRCIMEPRGYFDEAARKRGEAKTYAISWTEPRDMAGAAQTTMTYLDSEKPDNIMTYLPFMRKVRKMSPRDTQNDTSGQGRIDDDVEGFWQKLSPNRYPYRYEVLEEREYLVPAPTLDGAEYITTKGGEFRNIRLERRPLYVIRLTQLDRGYVYGSRILYIDKETFLLYHTENYDQKGRLFRTWDIQYSFFPDMGAFSWTGIFLVRDHINQRSNVDQPYCLPARWNRGDVNIDGFLMAK